MRVLMVTPSFYPIRGGAETVVRNLSVELKKIGVNVDVMTFNMDRLWNPRWSGKTEKIDGITVYKIPALNWLPLVHSPRINFGINLLPGRFRHLAKEYDVLHFHQAEFSFPFFSHSVRRPKILHLHGVRLDYFKRYHLSRIMLKTVADIYLSLSKQMEKDLSVLGIPEDKIVFFPNSVDTEVFYPKGERLDNTLLFVGRITPDKGLDVLLRSLRHVKRSVRLTIIGPVNKNYDLNYYRIILDLIKKETAKGKHKIEYLGSVDKTTLIKCYQMASIFILPSIYEPFAVVLLEAMSCGTPVIATYTGGVPEVVVNQKNGLLVPVNAPLKLAEAIDYMMENKDIRTAFGKASRERVKENFAIGSLVRKLNTIYEKLV
jgi:glycosyltransferase involved in cell wall biosynthesis